MTHPAEKRIRQPSDADLYAAMRTALPELSDQELIAELARLVVFVAVSWSDVMEAGEPYEKVLSRGVFFECDDLAGYFPWPE